MNKRYRACISFEQHVARPTHCGSCCFFCMYWWLERTKVRIHGHCLCFGALGFLFSKPRCFKMHVFSLRMCVGNNVRRHVWGSRRNSVAIDQKYPRKLFGGYSDTVYFVFHERPCWFCVLVAGQRLSAN